MESITIDELMNLSRKQLLDRCLQWDKEFNGGKPMNCNPLKCPVHIWVVYNHAKCRQEVVPNTDICPVCGHPCCPDCMNHNVEQLSRVTGYMSNVGSWNAAKQQEFKDRQRFNME